MSILSKITQKLANYTKHQFAIKGTEIFWNGDFYYVESKVNQGALGDPDGINFYYENDVENASLGSGVLACLNKCWDMEESDFPLRPAEMARKNASNYPARLSEEMKRFGYKHKRARNQNMLRVVVKLNDKTITLEPTNHVSLESWTEEKINPADHIDVASSVSNAEMGHLVKVAFERCKNDFNSPTPKTRNELTPPSLNHPKNAEDGIYEISLLCGGSLPVAQSIQQELFRSTENHPVLLGSELSKKGYCFSSNWKGALANFQDAFENFMARFDIENIIIDETKEIVYTSTDIFDCILLTNAQLLKHGYTFLYLNESPDVCELVLIPSSDLERVSGYLKGSHGIEIHPVSASS